MDGSQMVKKGDSGAKDLAEDQLVGDDGWPEKMNLTQARKFLGISFSTMTILIGTGQVETESDPLDRRVKLVRRAALEVLKRQRGDQRVG